MIGSHDTFTYLPPANPIFRLFTRWWRTQRETIDGQYKAGVRLFDIRVVRHRGRWLFAHGIVRLKGEGFVSLSDICWYIQFNFPGAVYRIVLERGGISDEQRFIDESQCLSRFDCLWRADIRREKTWLGKYADNNRNLYNEGFKFALVNTWESPSHELHGKVTKGNWYKVSLREEARRINSQLPFFRDAKSLRKMADSRDELYLLDYCTNEY